MKPIYLLALIPFIGMLGGVILFNQETPYVLGMPFVLFWIVLWVVICSLTTAIIYKLDPINKEGE
ncbi:MAG TPA: DUF3311 domain-containing protein [Bacillus sp. (in: firmicutes)]|nr:DUF3311 domain-containing protein [Bacillus sp. (in: firmicutes)]